MMHLYENEKVVMEVRKHWFMLAGPSAGIMILFFVPPAILAFLPSITKALPAQGVEYFVFFLIALFIMALMLLLFLMWTNYYLDMWIITNKRVIDIEQHSLFDRDVSEIPLNRIQDVTIEVKGLIETLLRFGTIRVQTAGEREFFIRGAPNLYEIKDAILKNMHQTM